MKEKFNSRYAKLGLTIFVAGAALILLFEAVINIGILSESFSRLMSIISPFIYGLVMAYLLCPVYNLVVRKLYKVGKNRFKSKKNAFRFSRIVATVVSLIVLIGAVGGLFALVLPETIASVVNLVQVVPGRLTDLAIWAEDSLVSTKHPEIADYLDSVIINARKTLINWTENNFMPKIGEYMSQISQGIFITVKTMFNVVIGIIVCVYFLNSKEIFKGQTRKCIMALVSRERANEIFEFGNFCNRTFGGFINGKLIDSVIIGIICFVAMTIIDLPYPVLVSSIIGVTNFIPFFGPFIGAVPSTIIICVESPIKALYFIILVIVLQTFDGNILGPKILGGTTGLASFWVMFAIILCGGIFGFVGMILGVPVFAVLYYYSSKFISKKLKRRNLPEDTVNYEEFNKYDIDRKEII
ncbi:MAG: AI-2E family transporter [Eubacteriaceae bacterium]|nr:AI-2E family transporter [Eubacteriaceae bacterium]